MVRHDREHWPFHRLAAPFHRRRRRRFRKRLGGRRLRSPLNGPLRRLGLTVILAGRRVTRLDGNDRHLVVRRVIRSRGSPRLVGHVLGFAVVRPVAWRLLLFRSGVFAGLWLAVGLTVVVVGGVARLGHIHLGAADRLGWRAGRLRGG
ncbi:hypothetical protein E1264_35455, partial [Actinomadura sp. KC216]|uniref:hypothetical protein n=1 Tax=Actinomadura sp. KC216 TaxID=2530370 RepID=UPI00104A3F88